MARNNQNRVEIQIDANTQSAQGSVNALKGGILSTFGDLGSAVTGIQSAISLTGSAVGALITPLKEASDANLDLISTANQFASVSGLSYGDSKIAIHDLNNEMIELGNTLPGVTDDYKNIAMSITDNLIPAVADLDGTFTTEGLNKYAKELAKNFGFIAATTDVSSREIGLGLNRALTEGTTIATLRQLAAFEKSPALLAQIEKVAASMGVEFDKATTAQRVQILTQASKISQQAIDEAGQDVMTLISGIQSQLFGSNGVFSFQRLIGGSESQLGTSIIQELGTTLAAIMSPTGPFAEVWQALAGIDFDPMVALRDWIINFRENTLPQIANIVSALMEAFDEGGLSGVSNQILEFLAGLDFSQIGYALGNSLGVAVNWLVGYIGSMDWSSFNQMVINILTGLGVALLAFVTTVNWGGMVATAFGVLGQLVMTTLTVIMTAINNGLTGIGLIVVSTVQSIFGRASGAVVSALSTMGNIVSAMVNPIQAIIRAVSAVVGRLRSIAASISNIGSNVSVPVAGPPAPNYAVGNYPGIMGGMIKEMIAMPDRSGLVMANSSEVIMNRDQQSQLLNALSSRNSGTNNFYITGNNPQEIARQIERMLGSRARMA